MSLISRFCSIHLIKLLIFSLLIFIPPFKLGLSPVRDINMDKRHTKIRFILYGHLGDILDISIVENIDFSVVLSYLVADFPAINNNVSVPSLEVMGNRFEHPIQNLFIISNFLSNYTEVADYRGVNIDSSSLEIQNRQSGYLLFLCRLVVVAFILYVVRIVYENRQRVYVFLCTNFGLAMLGISFGVIVKLAELYYQGFFSKVEENFGELKVQSGKLHKSLEWEERHKKKSKVKKDNPEMIHITQKWVKTPVLDHKFTTTTARDENLSHNLVGKVFDTKTFKIYSGDNVKLSNILRWIEWEAVPAIIGSLLSETRKFTNSKEAREWDEWMRRLRILKCTWHQTSAIEEVKNLLIEKCNVDPNAISSATDFKPNPRIFVNMDYTKLLHISDKHSGTLGFILNSSKKHQWPEHKIRSTVKNMFKDGATEEEVIAFFSKKLYIPDLKYKITEEKDGQRLAWFLPYVPLVIFKFDLLCEFKLHPLIRNYIVELKNKAIKFVKVLCIQHKMSRPEKKEAQRQRIEMFKNEMRQPSNQLLFLTGRNKKTICDDIHKELAHKFDDMLIKGSQFLQVETKRKRERRVKINTRRDEKFDRNYDVLYDESFSVQSGKLVGQFGEKIDVDPCNPKPTLYSRMRSTCVGLVQSVTSISFGLYMLIKIWWSSVLVLMGWSVFVKAFKEDFEEEIQNATAYWKELVNSPFEWASKDKNKLTMIQINSVCQIIYLSFQKKYEHIVGHALNLGISNWNNIYAITILFKNLFKRQKTLRWTVDGQERTGTIDDYANDLDNYKSGTPLAKISEFHTQAKDTTEAPNFTGLPEWSTKSLSEMNTKFLFVKNASSALTSLTEFIKALISIVGRTFFGIDPLSPEYMTYMEEVESILNNIHMLNSLTPSRRLRREITDIIEKMNDSIDRVKRDPLYVCIPNYKAAYFTKQIQDFKVIFEESKAMQGMKTERLEPVTVLFTGAAGSGKSTTMKYIERAITILDHAEGIATPPDILPEHTYNFNIVDSFWSGYRNQKFVEVDDIFSSKDIQMRAKEANEIIHIVNTASYQLNMPGLAEKGTTYFNSEYVFLTSNITERNIKSTVLELGMNCNAAFLRRMHLVLRRNLPFTGSCTEDMHYHVDQCVPFPHLEGKQLEVNEIIELIRLMKSQSIANRALSRPSVDAILDYVKMSRLRDDCELPVLKPWYSKLDDIITGKFNQESDELWEERESEQNKAFDALVAKFRPQSGSDFLSEFKVPWQIIKSDVKRGLFPWWSDISTRKYMIILLIAISSSSLLIWLFFFLTRNGKHELEEVWEGMQPESSWAKRVKTGRVKKTGVDTGPVKIVKGEKAFHPQNGEDFVVTNYEAAFPNLMSGCGRIISRWEEDGKTLYNFAQISHIKDGWFMTPTHFFLTSGANSTYAMCFEHQTYYIDQFEEYVQAENLDITVVKISHKNQFPKALFKYFPKTSRDTPIPQGTPMRLVTTNEKGEHKYKTINKYGTADKIMYPTAGQFFMFHSDIMYLNTTSDGDSGGIIVVQDSQKPMIVGMHVGIRNGKTHDLGISTPVTQELLNKLLEAGISEEHPLEEQINSFDPQNCLSEFPLEILKTLPVDESYCRPTRHNIQPSICYGWRGPSTCIPAKLTPFYKDGEYIDPYINGVKKLHQEYTPACSLPDGIVDWLLMLYPPQGSIQELSFEEIVRGTSKTFTSINIGTSPGYPYCLSKKKGKAPWFFIDEENFQINWTPEIETLMNEYDQELQNGRQIEVLWADVLKSERREIEKVEAGKTRLFASCPLHFLLLMRKYTGRLTEFMQERCVECPISVGLNPHSIEWTMIYNRLAKTAGSVIAGDFSNYDGIVPRFVGEVVLDFINSWYDDGPINARVRSLLFEHIYNPTRITGNIVYQVKDGNPSGNPWTSWYNSLCQLVMWYTVLSEDFKLDISTWTIVVYGDDNLLTTEETGLRCSDFKPYFKQRFNMEYTHFSKSNVDPHDSLETVRYLGRSFVSSNMVWKLAPLELSVVVESTYWTNGAKIDYEVLFSTIESFVNEAFHFGKPFFVQICKELSEWIDENVDQREIVEPLRERLRLSYNIIWNRNFGGVKTTEQYKSHA